MWNIIISLKLKRATRYVESNKRPNTLENLITYIQHDCAFCVDAAGLKIFVISNSIRTSKFDCLE